MPQSAVTLVSQTLDVDQVRDIVLTETVPAEGGGFIRVLKIMGEPKTTNPASMAVLLELRLRSEDDGDLAISTPAFEF